MQGTIHFNTENRVKRAIRKKKNGNPALFISKIFVSFFTLLSKGKKGLT